MRWTVKRSPGKKSKGRIQNIKVFFYLCSPARFGGTVQPEWRNGRRDGLKIHCPLKAWGFESPLGHWPGHHGRAFSCPRGDYLFPRCFAAAPRGTAAPARRLMAPCYHFFERTDSLATFGGCFCCRLPALSPVGDVLGVKTSPEVLSDGPPASLLAVFAAGGANKCTSGCTCLLLRD